MDQGETVNNLVDVKELLLVTDKSENLLLLLLPDELNNQVVNIHTRGHLDTEAVQGVIRDRVVKLDFLLQSWLLNLLRVECFPQDLTLGQNLNLGRR